MKSSPRLALFGLLLFFGGMAFAEPSGLITKAAKQPVAETAEQIEKMLRAAGLMVFAVIDHAAAAEKAGLRMPPARVIIFGNPKGGTPLMLNTPTVAIDLPLKILVWEDAAGKSWVSYNTATYIAGRHQVKGMEKLVQTLDGALGKLTSGVSE